MKICVTIICVVLSLASIATDISSGDVSGTWSADGNPYVILGDVRVPEGATLNIEPGVEIQFAGQHYLRILGNFNALGAEGDSIVFKSQTNSPLWRGIKLDSLQSSSDTARFRHCKITQMMNNGMAIINTNKVIMEDCRIHDNLDLYIGSVYVALGNPSFTRCTFSDNDGASSSEGAAMYIWDASPIIKDCNFIRNSTPWSSGAIALYRSDVTPEPQFINCLFHANWTNGSGGAVVSHSNCVPYFENCTFTENWAGASGGVIWDGYTAVDTTQFVDCYFEGNYSADDGGVAYCVSTDLEFIGCRFEGSNVTNALGAVIYAYDESLLNFDDCQFVGNSTNSQGGVMYINDYTDITINRCLFANNSAALGGAMYINSHTNAIITNSIFVNNEASNVGGAFRIVQFCAPEISNCLIANNVASSGGGAMSLYWEADPVLSNCIIWNNHGAGELNTYQVQEYIWNYCTPQFLHCIVEGGEEVSVFGDSGPGYYFETITDYPEFIAPTQSLGNTEDGESANWHFPSGGSPCENAGLINSSELGLGELDFDGNPRFSGVVDIGPFEGGQITLAYNEAIDLDDNGTVDSSDLLTFLASFGCFGADCAGDLNGDLVVNTADLLLFITLYGL